MKILHKITDMRGFRRSINDCNTRIGLVTTMGALHEGHNALLKAAKQECNITIATIFVNPAQFNSKEDYHIYPRDLDKDLSIMKQHNIDCVFIPSVEEMYPKNTSININLGEIMNILEGKYRQGHFEGVAAILTKFFTIIRPDAAYFGKKDAQQLALVHKLNQNLMFGIDIIAVDTIRDKTGLALSSRNKLIQPQDRKMQACELFKSLNKAYNIWKKGERLTLNLCKIVHYALQDKNSIIIDYVSIVNPNTFEESDYAHTGYILLIAAYVGKIRLIDNIELLP